MRTECKTELGVKVVFFKGLSVRCVRVLDQESYRFVAQQPNPDIHHEEVCLGQFPQGFERRFLEHEVELVRGISPGSEHPVSCGQGRVGPESVAHHVSLRYALQRLLGTEIHISACNQGMERLRCLLHYLFIQRKLQ